MTNVLSEEHRAWLPIRVEPVADRDFEIDAALLQSQGGRDLVVPYRREGKIMNRKYRGPQKRFRQDPGAPRMFWNEDSLRDMTLAKEPLVVSEGELDALAAI